ncbi:MAG TPA: S53 family peptidase [Mycobacteriales bacterium]|nr:S53 family peptidase [Mycobacteriales bacterium]
MRPPLRIGVASVAVGTLVGIVAPTAATAASPGTVRHTGSRPSWATAARDVGHANASDHVDLHVWLALRNEAQAQALAVAVSDPSSPQFGHYLTPAQFQQRYAQTAAEADAVASWLRAAGLAVTETPASHQYVAASGSVAQVAKALSIQLDNYSVRGQTWRAPANDPQVPADLAASIAGFTGLDTASHLNRPSDRVEPPPAGFANAGPLSAYYGEKTATSLPTYNNKTLPYAVAGYTPTQLRGAYGVTSSGLKGSGSTVAITDAYYSPTMVQDANQYIANHDPTAPPLVMNTNYFEHLASDFSLQQACGADGWLGEETLDVEAVHAMAPQANIEYFGAANCDDSGFLVALNDAANDPDVDVVTNSWDGYETLDTPDVFTAYDQVFAAGIDQGKAFLFSSGDDGDELAATGTKQVDYPASDPLVVAVGGTSVGIGASNTIVGTSGWGTEKATQSGTGWNDPSFLYGSGGGCSAAFAQPSWQTVTTGCSGSRGVPDVSMDADPTTGMLVGETQTFPSHDVRYGEYRIGGTSLASPLLAGVIALVDQASRAHQGANVVGPGVFYGLRSGLSDVQAQGSRTALPDAGNVRVDYVNGVDASNGTVNSVRTFGQDSSLTLGRGWDQTTGLGTINSGIYTTLPNALH